MKKLPTIFTKYLTIRKFILISLLFTMSSCMALHSGYVTNSASLSTNNFEYLKRSVNGTSAVGYFLTLGGLHKESLISDAFNNMKEKHPLNKNQAYTNITVNFKHTFLLGIFRERKCTISADIVEFQ